MSASPAKLRKPASPNALPLARIKAHLSAVVDGVEQKRTPVTILRRGVPVAQIVPFPGSPRPALRGSMAGTGRELGDIVSPSGTEWALSDEWTRKRE